MKRVAGLYLSIAVAMANAAGEEPQENAPVAIQESVVEATSAPAVVVLVEQIQTRLKESRRPLPFDDFQRIHREIVALVADLQRDYPGDERVAEFLPERWFSLALIRRFDPTSEARLIAEVADVVATSDNPQLKRDALYMQTMLRFEGPIDGFEAASLAEKFASQALDDKRASEFYYQAARKLDGAQSTRAIVLGLLVIVGLLLTRPKREHVPGRTKRALYALLGTALGLVLLVHALLAFDVFPNPWLTYPVLWSRIQDLSRRFFQVPVLGYAAYEALQCLPGLIHSTRTGIGLAVSGACGVLCVRFRPSRFAFVRKMSATRLGIFGFVAGLAILCILDIGQCSIVKSQVQQRMARDFADSFRGRMVEGQDRQRKRVGEPFELEFEDAISGAPISIQQFRGKVVVVDFWATWCGPCVHEIPELQRLYKEYHDQGVEFIGVSHDLPEMDGGLAALRSFVAEKKIPWPQYYEARGNRNILDGTPIGDFSEFWGIDGIPTVFLIDAEGKLYSTTARGQLETLIPRLLSARKAPPQ